jgi:hypothetical protein
VGEDSTNGKGATMEAGASHPIWSVIARATDGLVLRPVTAHGDDFDG